MGHPHASSADERVWPTGDQSKFRLAKTCDERQEGLARGRLGVHSGGEVVSRCERPLAECALLPILRDASLTASISGRPGGSCQRTIGVPGIPFFFDDLASAHRWSAPTIQGPRKDERSGTRMGRPRHASEGGTTRTAAVPYYGLHSVSRRRILPLLGLLMKRHIRKRMSASVVGSCSFPSPHAQLGGGS